MEESLQLPVIWVLSHEPSDASHGAGEIGEERGRVSGDHEGGERGRGRKSGGGRQLRGAEEMAGMGGVQGR